MRRHGFAVAVSAVLLVLVYGSIGTSVNNKLYFNGQHTPQTGAALCKA